MGGPATRPALGGALALCLAAPLLSAAGADPPLKPPSTWPGCCGLPPWAQASPLTAQRRPRPGALSQGFTYIVGGSPLRHHLGQTGQIPAAYAKLRNPLPPTLQNARAGAAVYEAECASCHGASGRGDGPAAEKIKPPPAQLGWLAQIPPDRRDAFMSWSIVDGGKAFGTAMPSYKGKLTDGQLWSVIGYIQSRLPTSPPAAR